MANQAKEEMEVMPKTPDVRKPATARAMNRAAGSKTGLKMTKSGVTTVRLMTVAERVRPTRMRRETPKGTRAARTRTLELEGFRFM